MSEIFHHIKKPEKDLGLGNLVEKDAPERFINKDGSFNIKKIGTSTFSFTNIYHDLITMSWIKFIFIVLLYYISVNTFFTLLYLMVGVHHLSGITGETLFDRFLDAFFFSAQTLTTVGYGRVSPEGLPANIVATLEALLGVIIIAIATGVCYGRFSLPNAKIIFSKNAIIAPYQDVTAFEFKLANERNNQLIDVEVQLTFSYLEIKNQKKVRKYVNLELERNKVNFFPLTWTIVHAINEESPLWELTSNDLQMKDAEFMILFKGFDDTFSQQVQVRSSYKYDEVVFNARFFSIFDNVENGKIVLDLSRIDEYTLL